MQLECQLGKRTCFFKYGRHTSLRQCAISCELKIRSITNVCTEQGRPLLPHRTVAQSFCKTLFASPAPTPNTTSTTPGLKTHQSLIPGVHLKVHPAAAPPDNPGCPSGLETFSKESTNLSLPLWISRTLSLSLVLSPC